MAEICENRGPRIGEDVAYCALPAGHLGSHVAHRDWGRNRPEWRNHDAQPITADRLTLCQPDLDPSSVSIVHRDGTTAVTFHGDGRVVVGELDDDRLRQAIEAASETLTAAHTRYEAELRQARADRDAALSKVHAIERLVNPDPLDPAGYRHYAVPLGQDTILAASVDDLRAALDDTTSTSITDQEDTRP